MSPEQRLIGMDLIELRALAFGGDPAAAAQVGQRLSRAAAALEQVSASLERAAGQIGPAWQGQAADAARTGIAGHAQWARTAAARAAAAGGNATAQAASANYVRANMPDPGVGSAALGPGGSPVGRGPVGGGPVGNPATTNPIGTNAAQVEEAQRNAQLRAVELLEGHAAKSQAQRPTGVLEAPPGGATTAAGGPAARGGAGQGGSGRGGVARPVRAPERVAGPGTATAEGSPATRPFASGKRLAVTEGFRGGAPAGTAGAAGGATIGRGGASLTRGADAANGMRPLPEADGYEVRGIGGLAGPGGLGEPGVLAEPGTGPGALAAGGAGAAPATGGGRRGWTPDVRAGVPVPGATAPAPQGGDPGAARDGASGSARAGEPSALPARHGAGVNQPTEQQAVQGVPGDRGGHRPGEGVAAASGLAPPVGGPGGPGLNGTGGTTSRSAHRRLGFLIDEDCAFDGDPDDSGWVSPPVIGA